MLAYNSAYPHTTKNIRQIKNSNTANSSQKSNTGNIKTNLNNNNPSVGSGAGPIQVHKKTRVSIQRV